MHILIQLVIIMWLIVTSAVVIFLVLWYLTTSFRHLIKPKPLYVKKMHVDAKIPTRFHEDDAGYDLYSYDNVIFAPYERKPVHTGIAIQVPRGHVGLVKSRSGWAFKQGVDAKAGVIDAGYRGELVVLLKNDANSDAIIAKHDRVAQLLLPKITTPPVVVVLTLDDSERSTHGFGSSGN